MHETEGKGCYNCKYRTTLAHWPPCDECPNNENWEAPEDMGHRSEVSGQRPERRGKENFSLPEVAKKRTAVRALRVVSGALREAAERLEQVQSDQGYTLHARQLRGAATMAEKWVEGIEREIENSKLEIRNRQEGGKIIGWILDQDDGYCD